MIINFREWTFEIDYEKTKQTYKSVSFGSPESCDCKYCLNFSKQRALIYPDEVKDLFEKLGIDYKKEAEIYQNCELERGLHSYGGWFHFAGKIIAGENGKVPLGENSFTFAMTDISDNFRIWFSNDKSLSFFEKGISLVQVEFEAKVPWILEIVVE